MILNFGVEGGEVLYLGEPRPWIPAINKAKTEIFSRHRSQPQFFAGEKSALLGACRALISLPPRQSPARASTEFIPTTALSQVCSTSHRNGQERSSSVLFLRPTTARLNKTTACILEMFSHLDRNSSCGGYPVCICLILARNLIPAYPPP
jgi:hypothetical protein